jgi:transforming growth factor-beta-induced protein
MHKNRFVALIAALVLALMLAPTASAQAQEDIVATAAANEDFSTLVAAVEAAGLAGALQGEGPFTVFAPTNEAFAALPEGTLDTLLADPQGDLTQILLYHVVPGKVMAADITDGLEVETLQGGLVKFTVADGKVMINDAEIVMTDIETSNGVIHVIDSVLIPPSGEAAPAEAPETTEPAQSIVDIAVANEDFSTLVAAVQAAGLVEALQGEGPFTVFAPTNDAFAALPEGTLEKLLADPSGDLAQILLYHVVPGAVMSSDLSDGMQAETLQGAPVTFTIDGDKVMVNDSNVVAADIVAGNGVIHVIDSVLLPPAAESASAEAVPAAEQAPQAMPVTGMNATSLPLPMVVVGLVLGGLAVGVILNRRRS